MTADELQRLAEETRDDALLLMRLRFNQRYGRYVKCATCGRYLRSAWDTSPTPECHGESILSGYSFPEWLAGKLEMNAQV